MASPDLSPLLDVAMVAARAGADVVTRSHGAHEAGHKGLPGDYVTEVDRASEAAILEVLGAEAGRIPVLAEERGGHTAERFWAVDPLDGTTNFLHGFSLVGVSVGLVERGRAILGAVVSPFQEETYAGGRGLGAELRRPGLPSEPLRV